MPQAIGKGQRVLRALNAADIDEDSGFRYPEPQRNHVMRVGPGVAVSGAQAYEKTIVHLGNARSCVLGDKRLYGDFRKSSALCLA